ncbi:copper chaperone PCu(A)C [Streptomyces sp. NBC_00078]|uniref:copper chaperone PCu(A)C n=1 Tax=unclassified Streptomyces TaxID=2593676 RepID=UPI00224EDBE5|nr:copper chaperone PCu(A)C [Streptomyces sp. NBC_00078]MCX5423628.1 copper chaperone PCu(A)C [Streptomyces sp. NBC_00078]
MTRTFAAALLVSATALTGCSSSPTATPAYDTPVLQVTGAYIRQPVTDDMAAGYFTVTNTGRQPDKLTGVTSDAATSVTMHRTTAENQMEPVQAFSIPAGGSLVLRTGGDHLMLMGFKKKPTVGETITLRLRFASSDSITVRAPVEPTTYQPSN